MAGHMKFATICIIAAALLAACSDSGSPEPASTTTPLPPPTATQPAPTPTLPPPPSPTLPPPLEPTSGIDTSDWPTYDSPLGITMSYPPEWIFVGTFAESGEPDADGTFAVMYNGVQDPTREAAGTPGVMRATIRATPREFDPDHFLGTCPGLADIVSIDGHRAVICDIEDITPAGLEGHNFWLVAEIGSGKAVRASSSTIGPSGNDVAIARAIIESVGLAPPNIDTSAWPTFSSPLGFDIKYPPGWTVAQSEPSDFPLQRARIHNELAWKNYEPRIGTLGRGYLPESGEAWFHISPNPLPYFDVRGLISICGTEEQREEGSSRAHETAVDGHRAVQCIQTGLALGGQHQMDSNILSIEEPPGRAVHIGYTVIGGDPEIIAIADAALATIAFHE